MFIVHPHYLIIFSWYYFNSAPNDAARRHRSILPVPPLAGMNKMAGIEPEVWDLAYLASVAYSLFSKTGAGSVTIYRVSIYPVQWIGGGCVWS